MLDCGQTNSNVLEFDGIGVTPKCAVQNAVDEIVMIAALNQ
jgi:hypothetical protein